VGFVFLIIGIFVVCGLVSFLSWIWLLALGFRRHWGWGCALLAPTVLFIVALCTPSDMQAGALQALRIAVLVSPVVFIAFIIVAWPEAKYPFFWMIGVGCVWALAFYGTVFYAVETSEQLKAMLKARGYQTAVFDRAAALRADPGAQPKSRAPSGAQNSPDQGPGVPPPPGVFHSRLPPRQLPPGEREPARPGIYYLLEHVSTRTPRGVQNGLPGEMVTLLNRLPGGKMRVTVGNADFVVNASQLTDDIEVAREAEKRDFVARGGQL
jgi:hypothetical protein